MKNRTTSSSNSKRVARVSKNILHAIAFCSLIFVFQSCVVHYVADIPMAPIEVRPAPPYANAIWIDGGWGWRGGHHNWVGGYWDRPRGGEWQAGEWRHSPRGHYWVHGHRR